MSKNISKKSVKLILLAVVIAGAAFFGYRYWKAKQTALPEGFASGNGRLEAKLVDVAAKEPLRVKEILMDEGDLVEPGQVLVQMDTVTLEAELAQAKANVAATQERLAIANAAIVRVKSEIELVATIQTRIDDATLKSPVRGRVLYRLTEVGEVLAPAERH
jgi:HlyD family secretion protein